MRVIGADAAEPERVQRAEASVSNLMHQLAELQKGGNLLSEQASCFINHHSIAQTIYAVKLQYIQ